MEVTGDLIGNETVDKINSASKPKYNRREEDNEVNETQEIYIPPEMFQQIIDDLR